MMKIEEKWIEEAKINSEMYNLLYKNQLMNFWNKQGDRIDWFKKYTKIKNVKYSKNDVNIKWYEDGKLNVSYNCIDRHANETPDKIAIIWEGDK